jgi:hypothetical protein
MLTPKCRPRDSRVSACAITRRNRLCRSDENLRRQNLAGFCEKSGHTARPLIVPGRLGKAWLCWQSEANPSLPAKVINAGRLRRKAARVAAHPLRKSRHLNAPNLPLPTVESRESLLPSREASRTDKVFPCTQPRHVFDPEGYHEGLLAVQEP